MACCGGSRPQRVRRQVVEPVYSPSKQTVPAETVVQKKITRRQTEPASMQRQYIVPREQCTKCGYPAMLVNIAGRERRQCTNANCRLVLP
jgi:hypothetical protein